MNREPAVTSGRTEGLVSITPEMERWREERAARVLEIAYAAIETLLDGDTRTLPGIPAQTRLAWNPSGKPVIVISADDPSVAFSAMARAWPTCETFSLSVTPDPGFRCATAIAPHGA